MYSFIVSHTSSSSTSSSSSFSLSFFHHITVHELPFNFFNEVRNQGKGKVRGNGKERKRKRELAGGKIKINLISPPLSTYLRTPLEEVMNSLTIPNHISHFFSSNFLLHPPHYHQLNLSSLFTVVFSSIFYTHFYILHSTHSLTMRVERTRNYKHFLSSLHSPHT